MARPVPITKLVYVERTRQPSDVSARAILAAVLGGAAVWALIIAVIWLIMEGL